MADTQNVVRTALDHFRAERFTQAAEILKRAVQKDPKYPGGNQLYALTLMALHKPDAALFYIRRAIEAMPNHSEFHANLGLILSTTYDKAGAEAAFRRALELEPQHPDAAARLSHMLAERGQQVEAMEVLQRAQHADPLNIGVACALAKVYSDMTRSDEAVALLRDVLPRALAAGRPPDLGAISLLCLLTNYIENEPARVMEVHRSFGGYIRTESPTWTPGPRSSGRLRIGYLSPDIRRHSVTSFLEPLLKAHNRDRVEVFVYSLGAYVDDVTKRFETLPEHWRPIGPQQDNAVLEAVRRDRLDVLVELSGHTMNNRLGLLGRRVAAVQATYLGYPATTGSPGIDIRIVDDVTDPEGADLYATERLVRLPRCFLCFQPPDEAPNVQDRSNGPIVFGSFNNPAKISEATVELWSRVLKAVSESRLILKGSSLGLSIVQDQLATRFMKRGVDRSRLEFLGTIAEPHRHLAEYARVDVGLDPTPYNGTTTTCEALWMGVPVLTITGRTHAARVGTSLLSATGLSDLIADSPEAFVRIAQELAGDLSRLATLRGSLRERVATSPLCDRRSHAAAFEDAMSQAVRTRR